MQPGILILLALLGAAAMVPLARRRASQRKKLALLAMQNGWTYTRGDPWDLPAEMEGFWLGTWGHDRRCYDVISIPTRSGALWLAHFERQMSSGRHRHTQPFALAMVRINSTCGGIAILPQGERFAATDPFQRYRRIECTAAMPHGQIWAERTDSEASLITALGDLAARSHQGAAIEVRGNSALLYWPAASALDEKTVMALAASGEQLIAALSSPACHESP